MQFGWKHVESYTQANCNRKKETQTSTSISHISTCPFYSSGCYSGNEKSVSRRWCYLFLGHKIFKIVWSPPFFEALYENQKVRSDRTAWTPVQCISDLHIACCISFSSFLFFLSYTFIYTSLFVLALFFPLFTLAFFDEWIHVTAPFALSK